MVTLLERTTGLTPQGVCLHCVWLLPSKLRYPPIISLWNKHFPEKRDTAIYKKPCILENPSVKNKFVSWIDNLSQTMYPIDQSWFHMYPLGGIRAQYWLRQKQPLPPTGSYRLVSFHLHNCICEAGDRISLFKLCALSWHISLLLPFLKGQ